jgi:hypothetical protein
MEPFPAASSCGLWPQGCGNSRSSRDTFYREEVHPFLQAAKTDPFFFEWRRTSFPNDVGYCWLSEDTTPTKDFATGRFMFTQQVNGIGRFE